VRTQEDNDFSFFSISRGTNSLLQLLVQFARTIVECLFQLFSFGLYDPKIGCSPLNDSSSSGERGKVNIYFMDMFTRLWLSKPTATIIPMKDGGEYRTTVSDYICLLVG
jgi:hypothetical protein